MRLIYILCCFCYLIAQNEIRVLVSKHQNEITLFETKLIKDIIDFHNKKTNKQYQLRFIPVSFSQIFSMIQKNKADLAIYNISITKDREEKFSFSDPYLNNKIGFLAAPDQDSKKKPLTEGNRIGVIKKSIDEQIAFNFKEKHRIEVVEFLDVLDRNEALRNHEIDYVLSDFIDQFIYQLKWIEKISAYDNDKFGILFIKNSNLYNELKPSINEFLHSIMFSNLTLRHFGRDLANYLD